MDSCLSVRRKVPRVLCLCQVPFVADLLKALMPGHIALGILKLKRTHRHHKCQVFDMVRKPRFVLLVSQHQLALERRLVDLRLTFQVLQFVVVLNFVHRRQVSIEIGRCRVDSLNLVVLKMPLADRPVVIILLVTLHGSCRFAFGIQLRRFHDVLRHKLQRQWLVCRCPLNLFVLECQILLKPH